MLLIFEQQILYSRNYWRSLHLAVWSQTRHDKILVEFKFGFCVRPHQLLHYQGIVGMCLPALHHYTLPVNNICGLYVDGFSSICQTTKFNSPSNYLAIQYEMKGFALRNFVTLHRIRTSLFYENYSVENIPVLWLRHSSFVGIVTLGM